MIRESLAGKRIAITGATGFLGTALVERLLRCVPDCELVVLIRPGRKATATDRMKKEILRNDCFDRLRKEQGKEFETKVMSRISAIGGDVTSDGLGLDEKGREILASCDIVV